MQIYPPGTMIGQYEIASNPMLGGMGVVYFCLDHENNDIPVALKTFKSEYLPDRAARDRFLREGTAWVALGNHQHIVRCYVVRYIDPTAFLVLEPIAKEQYHDDASLRSWLGAPMPMEQALLFALQIARGLAYACTKIPGFVHRDLKPENVLVGADKLPGTYINRLRVTDFGLAAILKDEGGNLKDEDRPESTGRTHLTHGIVGTPLYMAPEQWKGEALGTYTDVYALGCILYEMLTGQHAIKGKTISDLQAAHCGGKLHPLPADWPRELRDILIRSMAVRPTERYQSWEEITHALEATYAAQGGRPAPDEEIAKTDSPEARSRAGWSYNEIGLAYLHMGKTEVARNYFERARAVGIQEKQRQLESTGLSNLGWAYVNLGHVYQAIECSEQALVIDREIGDRRGEGIDLGGLGVAFRELGNTRKAISCHEQQLAIFQEIGDQRGEASVLNNLGIAYLALGDAQRGIGYYEQALAIARETGNQRGEAGALSNLGSTYVVLGDMQRAIEYFERTLVVAREIGDRQGEGGTLGNLGVAYKNLGDLQRAIGYYEQALAIAREIGDKRGEGGALDNLGVAYKNLGNLQQAIGYYEQALVISREFGNRRGEGGALSNLGTAYNSLGDARRAIEYYEQALVIDREIGDRRGEGGNLGNLGTAWLRLGEDQRAIVYFEQALAISRTIHDQRKEGINLGNLAEAHRLLGDLQQAIKYYEQALIILREIGDLNGVATFSCGAALLYAELGEAARGLPLAQEAVQIFAHIGHQGNMQRAQQLVARLQQETSKKHGGVFGKLFGKKG